MHATAFFAAAGLLTTYASAAPAANAAPPFQITNTNISRVVGGNTSIEFTVYDPNKIAKATTVCNGTWVYGSRGFPSGSYESCVNSSLAWNMQSFDSIDSFVLGIEHQFVNPAVGQPPNDVQTNFADGNVTTAKLQCTSKGGQAGCVQRAGTVIKAPIYETDAKRR